MKKLTRFFFYYTFLLLNALTVVSVSFLDSPYNLIYAVILVPSLLFFWLKITDPIGATESSWSARLVVSIGILSSLAILGFYLLRVEKTEIAKLEEQLVAEKANSSLQVASISGELALLRAELIKEKQTQVLNASDSGQISDNESSEILDLLNSLEDKNNSSNNQDLEVTGQIKYTGQVASNVYQQQNSSSKIVGVVEPSKVYDYYQYTGAWYLIELSEGRQGWVESDKVVLQP